MNPPPVPKSILFQTHPAPANCRPVSSLMPADRRRFWRSRPEHANGILSSKTWQCTPISRAGRRCPRPTRTISSSRPSSTAGSGPSRWAVQRRSNLAIPDGAASAQWWTTIPDRRASGAWEHGISSLTSCPRPRTQRPCSGMHDGLQGPTSSVTGRIRRSAPPGRPLSCPATRPASLTHCSRLECTWP